MPQILLNVQTLGANGAMLQQLDQGPGLSEGDEFTSRQQLPNQ